ncbi:serine/threonine-protein kinase [Kitasatospora terrestris]|uniref:Protein kinase domain-containing protein n=1 Tax=Kitasatospora terrestris TaxID=258051 RepID=A0ABP9DCG3_9ACTN
MEVDTGATIMLPGLVVVLGLALVVRLLSLPLLTAAQRAARRRTEAVRDGRPSALVSPAALGELVLGLAGGVGLVVLIRTQGVSGFGVLTDSVAFEETAEFAIVTDLDWSTARTVFVVLTLVLLAAGLLLWFLTQRNLLGTGPGRRLDPATRTRLALVLLLRAAVGVFVPSGLVLAALLVQAVALLTSRSGLRASVTPPAGHLPPVPAGAPAHLPPVPSRPSAQPPAHPAGYVPTQADAGPVAAHPVHQALRPGEPRTIGGYRLLGRIGAGGMGTVYLAQRQGAATQVALKTLNPELLDDTELLRRFEREARVLAMVPGDYTARVLDTGVDAGRPYLAMELLDGRPLDVHLREHGPIREPQALRALALALAVALSEVHRLGLVHRDLKPGNIMLTTAGPRLLDFGIASIVDGTRLTRTGGGPGTLTYMAPEQLDDGAVGPSADIWAWACCVVCAAHGASPFAATSTGAVIRRIVDTGPEPLALGAVQALDPALAAVVTRALTSDPAARPADGAALAELLAARPGPSAPLADAVRDQITRGWRTLAL